MAVAGPRCHRRSLHVKPSASTIGPRGRSHACPPERIAWSPFRLRQTGQRASASSTSSAGQRPSPPDLEPQALGRRFRRSRAGRDHRRRGARATERNVGSRRSPARADRHTERSAQRLDTTPRKRLYSLTSATFAVTWPATRATPAAPPPRALPAASDVQLFDVRHLAGSSRLTASSSTSRSTRTVKPSHCTSGAAPGWIPRGSIASGSTARPMRRPALPGAHQESRDIRSLLDGHAGASILRVMLRRMSADRPHAVAVVLNAIGS